MTESGASWDQIQDILGAALDLAEAERSALLDERCGDDAALRAEVESLLEASEGADAYFGALADRAGMTLSTLVEHPDADPTTRSRMREKRERKGREWIGQRVGQYLLKGWLGQGGMANVYLAEREGEGFTQRVAFKVVPRKRVFDSDVQRRSEEERRILARLEHRNIARLIDGGVTPEGYPFYAMEYVEGADLLEHCDQERLGITDRLNLFLEVCAPVQFAHEQLVVHCDLKPSNIFVTAEGHVKLLDFGVARLIDPDSEGDQATGLWFTPAYASPEQVRRERPGASSDVYSLGVLLYEMLTGRRPYTFDGSSEADVRRAVTEVVPTAPSSVVTQPTRRTKDGEQVSVEAQSLATLRGVTPDRLRAELRGDLDAIVLRALSKNPADRYRTVAQLAEDVRRHLAHLPLTTVPSSRGYRLRKFVRRNRGGVAAAALVALALSVGGGMAAWQASRATDATSNARDEAEKAELVASLMLDMFRLTDPAQSQGDTVTAREILDRGTARIQAEFGDQPDVQAMLLSEVSAVYASLGLFARAEPLVRQALEIREAELGPDDPGLSGSLVELGSLQMDQGDLGGSIETFERAVRLREDVVPMSDSILIAARSKLAWQVRSAREYERAEGLFSQALEGERLRVGDSPAVADLMLGLASTFHDAGQFDQADSLFNEVLSELDPSEGPTPMGISALTNVGMIRRLRQQYREAEPLLRLAVSMSTRLYGPDHVRTFDAQAQLGLVLYGTGDWAEAEALLRDAMARSEVSLGRDATLTARLADGLSTVLFALGHYEESVGLSELALNEMTTRHEGRDHPGVVAAINRVADSMVGAGRLDEARGRVEEALEMNGRITSGSSVYTMQARQTMGVIETRQGALAEAEPHFDAALEMAEELLREDHRYVLSLKREYGIFLGQAGRTREARNLLSEVLATQAGLLGDGHPLLERTRTALAGVS